MTTDYDVKNNITYLASGMFYLGFGDRHTPDLVAKMENNPQGFQLEHTALRNGKETNYVIDFKPAQDSPWMNLTGYKATLKEQPERTQYFSVYRNRGITAKEASSMLEGKPICKTQKIGGVFSEEAWHRLNFDKTTKNKNFVTEVLNKSNRFSVERAVNALPWSQTEGKGMPDWIVSDLKKGNTPEGILNIDGQDVQTMLQVDLDNDRVLAVDAQGEAVAVGIGLDPEIQRRREEREAERAAEAKGISADPSADQASAQQSNVADTGVEAGKQQPTVEGKADQKQEQVSKAMANDPQQKKTEANGKKEKEGVQRAAARSHPPLDGASNGKGKKR